MLLGCSGARLKPPDCCVTMAMVINVVVVITMATVDDHGKPRTPSQIRPL
jgi:hypothetical protein